MTASPSPTAPARSDRKRSGPRPKHVPQRMCVACREHDAKRGLIRIVRTPEGPVEIDPTGKRNGRGAYLCHDPACWERALRGGGAGPLARALNTTIDDDAVAALRRHAAPLMAEPAPTVGGDRPDTQGER